MFVLFIGFCGEIPFFVVFCSFFVLDAFCCFVVTVALFCVVCGCVCAGDGFEFIVGARLAAGGIFRGLGV